MKPGTEEYAAKVGDFVLVQPSPGCRTKAWRLRGKVGTVEKVRTSCGFPGCENWAVAVLARFGKALHWVSIGDYRVLDPVMAIALAGKPKK